MKNADPELHYCRKKSCLCWNFVHCLNIPYLWYRKSTTTYKSLRGTCSLRHHIAVCKSPNPSDIDSLNSIEFCNRLAELGFYDNVLKSSEYNKMFKRNAKVIQSFNQSTNIFFFLDYYYWQMRRLEFLFHTKLKPLFN